MPEFAQAIYGTGRKDTETYAGARREQAPEVCKTGRQGVPRGNWTTTVELQRLFKSHTQ